jgi:hypothetical protein
MDTAEWLAIPIQHGRPSPGAAPDHTIFHPDLPFQYSAQMASYVSIAVEQFGQPMDSKPRPQAWQG